MGRVAAAYGVRGWIKVAPGGGVAQTLAGVREWWIGDELHLVAAAKLHSASVVAKLDGIETREQAMRLKGARVAIERAALVDPAEGPYYFADLIGLEVRNEQDEVLGTVKQWLSNGAQDVREVAGSRTGPIPWPGGTGNGVDSG